MQRREGIITNIPRVSIGSPVAVMQRMTIRRVILCLLLLAAATLRAEERAARFFVERIDVRDAHHVSRDVVIAESRLREGETYSEQELREGNLRLNRAPYLLSADFSLEKGS